MLKLQPGDIAFVHSEGLIAQLIRLVTRRRGEKRTFANHVAMVINTGWLSDVPAETSFWPPPILVDAQPPRVKTRSLRSYDGELVAIYRPRMIPAATLERIAKRAERFDGKRYGKLKVLLHLVGLRGLACVDRWPICSYTVAVPYAEEGYSFGAVGAKAADPDDIWDFVNEHPDLYECIRELKPLRPGRS